LSRPVAVAKAEQAAAQFGSDAWAAAEGLGVPVTRGKLPAPYKEIYFNVPGRGPGVIVAPDVEEPETSAYVAHGLGHHLLHAGNRVAAGGLRIWTGCHEKEADDFAACFLVPEARLRQQLSAMDLPPLPALAEDLGVPTRLLERRLELLGGVDQTYAPA
jgi:Zn-dependent peptidase ImmA (M78 family)